MDITETMRVGPEGSGASAGPACYRKGGRDATVTDANLVLGNLPGSLLGGDFMLGIQEAAVAVDSIASQMKLSVTQTAEDIINLVNETMYGGTSPCLCGARIRSQRLCLGRVWRRWSVAC